MNKKTIIMIGIIIVFAGAALLIWQKNEQKKEDLLIAKQEKQLQESYQKLDKIVAGQSDIKSTGNIGTDQKLQMEIDRLKNREEFRELALTASILLIVLGTVIIFCAILLSLIAQWPSLRDFTAMLLSPGKNKNDESLPGSSTLADITESPQSKEKPGKKHRRPKKHSKVLNSSGWHAARPNSATEVETLLTYKSSYEDSDVTDESATGSETPVSPAKPLEPSGQRPGSSWQSTKGIYNISEDIREQQSSTTNVIICEETQEKPELETENGILEPAEPVSNVLTELAQHVAAIREYASSQQDRVEKLQDGYDWNIIRTFCLRIIRSIDNLESRIESLSQQNMDASDLEEIRDELIFALESSGIEPFEPAIYSDYRGLEKIAEAVKDKEQCCDNAELKGKISKVIRRGYKYTISEDNYKVVRSAQVRLFA